MLATDGGPASTMALEWAKQLGQHFGAKVSIAAIVPPEHIYSAPGHEDMQAEASARFLADVEGALTVVNRAKLDLEAAGVEAAEFIRYGDASHEIEALAEERQAQLIIVGSSHHTAMERRLVGSVADELRKISAINILIAKNQPWPARFLVAADDSRQGRLAVSWGTRLAHVWGAPITMFHAFDEPVYDAMRSNAPTFGLPKRRSDPLLHYESGYGPAAQIIVAEAMREEATLVVVGTRGLHGIRSLLSPSISSRVAHLAPMSVLVINEHRALEHPTEERLPPMDMSKAGDPFARP